MSAHQRREVALARAAARQRGLVSWSQLRELGFSEAAIGRRIAAGRLHRIHRGVYAVGHPVIGREGRWLAAVLSVGGVAYLSHASAAQLWDLVGRSDRSVDVTTTARGRRSTPGVRVHTTLRLRPGEVTSRSRIPVTTVERTIVDFASTAAPRRVERAIELADARHLVDVPTLLASARHRPGAAKVRAVLEAWAPLVTRSELEERFVGLVDAAGIGRPESNARVAGIEVDFVWRAQHVIAETDGLQFHASRSAFERDRARDARLTRAGHRVLRFSWAQVTRRPTEVADTLAAALAQV